MGKPIQKHLIGTEYLPQVTKEYAETLEGFTEESCYKMDMPIVPCDALVRVLGPANQGIIYEYRKNSLNRAGFSWSFIQGLAGNDGRKALENRIRWLTDHAVTKWWRLDYDLKERKQIINELALYQDASSQRTIVPFLLEVFKKGTDSELQGQVVQALKNVSQYSDTVLPIWISALQDEKWKVRRLAVQVLGDLGPRADAAVPFLIEHLRKDHPTIQVLAAAALGKMGEAAESAAPELARSLLWKTDPSVRKAALKALIEIGSREEVDVSYFPQL